MGAFQTLAMAAWKYGLPEGISNGQVRSALTAVMKNMFAVEGNFNSSGFLQLGFAGHQPGLANYYTNNGSLYMTSLVFMPLGLRPIILSGQIPPSRGPRRRHGADSPSPSTDTTRCGQNKDNP